MKLNTTDLFASSRTCMRRIAGPAVHRNNTKIQLRMRALSEIGWNQKEYSPISAERVSQNRARSR